MREGGEEVVLDAPGPLRFLCQSRGLLLELVNAAILALQLCETVVGQLNPAIAQVQTPRQGGEGDENVGQAGHSDHQYPSQMQRRCPSAA